MTRTNLAAAPKTFASKPNIVRIPNEAWKQNKKPMFQWAENRCAQLGIKANYLNILKAIIAQTDKNGITYATVETIHRKLVERYGKAAPSPRTIDRAIHKLSTAGLIKRDTQEKAKTAVRTRLLRYKSVNRSTSKRRAEYILPQSNIYIGKAKTHISPPSHTINKPYQESQTDTPLWAVAQGGSVGSQNSTRTRTGANKTKRKNVPPVKRNLEPVAPSSNQPKDWRDEERETQPAAFGEYHNEGLSKFEAFRAWRRTNG